MTVDTVLMEGRIDTQDEFASFLGGLEDEGAVVSFVGVARPRTPDGALVERLFLDHHPRLTERSVQAIAEAASKRFDVTAVKVAHRHGDVRPRETIVFVAAASAHRRAAFEAAEYIMDRLKTEAVFWKREDAADGSHWIEPTPADCADRARWSD